MPDEIKKGEANEKNTQEEERLIVESMIETPFFRRHRRHMPATIRPQKEPTKADTKADTKKDSR